LSKPNGAGFATAAANSEARKKIIVGNESSSSRTNNALQVAWLLCSRRRVIARAVPGKAPSLFHIEWPDIGLSPAANLTRCKQAALEWAEGATVTERRDLRVGRRLKSSNFFWRPASLVRQNRVGATP
jgi:hypothetical protein